MRNIAITFYDLLTYLFRRSVRHLYWLYRLSGCKIGKNVKFEFPLVIEGSGKFEFENNVRVSRGVSLGAGAGSTVIFGLNTEVQEQFYLRAAKGLTIKFGRNCSLGRGTVVYTNADWQIGDDVVIASHCALHAREPGENGKFSVGEGSHIGDNTIVDLTANVDIGKYVAIGPNCTLYTHDHDYRNTNGKPAWKGPLIKNEIKIEDGAWIGSNVTILPGVTIGAKTVVASGSVVTKSFEAGAVIAGVPAQHMKARD